MDCWIDGFFNGLAVQHKRTGIVHEMPNFTGKWNTDDFESKNTNWYDKNMLNRHRNVKDNFPLNIPHFAATRGVVCSAGFIFRQ